LPADESFFWIFKKISDIWKAFNYLLSKINGALKCLTTRYRDRYFVPSGLKLSEGKTVVVVAALKDNT